MSGIVENWGFRPSNLPFPWGLEPLSNFTWDYTSFLAKWHLIPSNGFSRVHECDRRHIYIQTDRLTDHAAVKSVAIDGIALAIKLIKLIKICEQYVRCKNFSSVSECGASRIFSSRASAYFPQHSWGSEVSNWGWLTDWLTRWVGACR